MLRALTSSFRLCKRLCLTFCCVMVIASVALLFVCKSGDVHRSGELSEREFWMAGCTRGIAYAARAKGSFREFQRAVEKAKEQPPPTWPELLNPVTTTIGAFVQTRVADDWSEWSLFAPLPALALVFAIPPLWTVWRRRKARGKAH